MIPWKVPVERYASVVDVHVILRRGGQVLLLRRAGDVYASGQLCLPSGHLERGENLVQAAVRETAEEAGIALDPAALRQVLSIHQRSPGGEARIGFAFEPDWWSGEPANAEPHKHSELVWADPGALPSDTVGYAVAVITAVQRGESFVVNGWFSPPGPAETPEPRPSRIMPGPRLIVIRGNSASGKSAVAAAIRQRRGQRDLAIVSQDNLRRIVLREHDAPGAANIGLIDITARHARRRGFHVIVEGILRARHYGSMLTALISDYPGSAYTYYLDVPFDETLRRHAAKPRAGEYGELEMRSWYQPLDLLPAGLEQVIPASSTLDATVTRVLTDTGLGS
jgi:8-oxo-dGTP pyrophosphatase MutT (NUDIX family)/predicted kinase